VGIPESWIGGGVVVQETKKPTIKQPSKTFRIFLKHIFKTFTGEFMLLLVLEALLALLILIGIVWWTMFSGRSSGEIKGELKSEIEHKTKAAIHDEKEPPQS
jgi:hypothetical protein